MILNNQKKHTLVRDFFQISGAQVRDKARFGSRFLQRISVGSKVSGVQVRDSSDSVLDKTVGHDIHKEKQIKFINIYEFRNI